jgi:hypothetical protein
MSKHKGIKEENKQVNIAPGVNLLSVLSHLNYKPWFALGEFVDNALQSALDNWSALRKADGKDYRLKVEIDIRPEDDGLIVIRDNAAGIPSSEYSRAFRTAEVPPRRNGLSEFGMGMKSAGFWFSQHWTVRTKALGESFSAFVDFDLKNIIKHSLENLPVETQPTPESQHFTELMLWHPEKMPYGRTIGKIREHLASIYRQFIEDGVLELRFCGELLQFEQPTVLLTPNPYTASEEPVEWKKQIDIRLTDKHRVFGFMAIRAEGSTSEAGLALFRRRRLILGSGDEGYRPEVVFGRSNDFRYQRVFGELHVEGFDVSHTKDGIQWGALEDDFLLKLKQEANKPPLPLLRMALDYRGGRRTNTDSNNLTAVLDLTVSSLNSATPIIAEQLIEAPDTASLPPELAQAEVAQISREETLRFQDQEWIVAAEVIHDPAVSEWLTFSQADLQRSARNVRIRINSAHPFIQRFASRSADELEPWIRLGAGLAIAEIVARDQGVRQAGTIRRHLNQLLGDALSRPTATADV